ncbi:hypothetical protein [Saccharicrinis aurantiacus]|uniref:hypothetical protein n=1 Tax=Saccharicrinis aurantiacus TaxID=1849719 RepID=UPI00094FF019|nr:hypothetical protein [Saccharicrinis aurantiacus]
MARQKGIIKLEGRVGDLSFYKSDGQYLARTKGGVDADRIKNDPAFVRTRENGAEFGRAGKASKLLRNVFKAPLAVASDKKVASRLTTQMLKVAQSDSSNIRGERTVTKGDLGLLLGFEFNVNTSLEDIMKVSSAVSFDRATGAATVSTDFTNPKLELAEIEGADVARMTIGVAVVDFESAEFEVNVAQSDAIDITSKDALTSSVSANISADSTLPVFIVLGIEYYQKVNDELYLINSQDSRALTIVGVDTV